jgi:hypothetical protein
VVVENAGGPAGKFLDLVDKDAFTVGNVVLARDKLPEASTSYQHERNHVDQYQIFGPFFPPTYGLFQAAGWAISSVTDDPNDAPEDYNLFEIWAGDY